MDASKRIIRQTRLPKLLARDPFLTDEQLAQKLKGQRTHYPVGPDLSGYT
jgi:hypothetical protein